MILVYWFSRGVTEGLKWSEKPYTSALYHIWRLIEVLAVVGAVLLYNDFWNFIGWNLIGIFFYERILMKIASDKWFKDKGTIFDIGITIKRYKWQDYCILLGGIICLV